MNNKTNQVQAFKLLAVKKYRDGRGLVFSLFNSIGIYDPIDIVDGIYTSVFKNRKFKKLGNLKTVIVVTSGDGNIYFNFHPNVLVDSQVTVMDYYNSVNEYVSTKYNPTNYNTEMTNYFDVIVWGMDDIRNSEIKINKVGGHLKVTTKVNKRGINVIVAPQTIGKRGYATKACSEDLDKYTLTEITPLRKGDSTIALDKINSLAVMDIETVKLEKHNNIQIPVHITISYYNNGRIDKSFTVSSRYLNSDNLNSINNAVNKMFTQYFEYMIENKDYFKVVYAHNLGSFDGIFVMKQLLDLYPENTSCTMDEANKYISIKYTGLEVDTSDSKVKEFTIEFKDSMRVFPGSLNSNAKMFGVEGKTSEYNPEFNSINLFKDNSLLKLFKEYATQDSVSLYETMCKARELYLKDYDVDITTIFSTSTLSNKIFRLKFLKVNIPVFKPIYENFIRLSYLGGATDYYKAFGENLYYYDVNSLYPYVMAFFKMPYKLLRVISGKEALTIDLMEFFGFLRVEVYCPDSVKIPVLPYKYNGKTIFPRGRWVFNYFSEELKACVPLGYEFKILVAYEFSKIDLFSAFIAHFYEIKKNSTGAKKGISKLHLNLLYGYFGRAVQTITTSIIRITDLKEVASKLVIKAFKGGNDKYTVVQTSNNLPKKDLIKLNQELGTEIESPFTSVKSNVAIASAVTAYARTHMMKYKLDGSVLYTDTDSIITSKPLPDYLVGPELGQMKDEMSGLKITRAYFLGIKKYAYQYIDKDGVTITKTVFAGVKKNSLTWEEVESIYNGESVTKQIKDRFYRNINDLSVTIKDTKVSIQFKTDKPLVDGEYIPLTINDLPKDISPKVLNNYTCKLRKLLNKVSDTR